MINTCKNCKHYSQLFEFKYALPPNPNGLIDYTEISQNPHEPYTSKVGLNYGNCNSGKFFNDGMPDDSVSWVRSSPTYEYQGPIEIHEDFGCVHFKQK